jgi:hypothetical protein
MTIMWDDPELDDMADEIAMLEAGLDIDPDDLLDMEMEARLRERPHGFTDEGEGW